MPPSSLVLQASCWVLLLLVAHPVQSASLNALPDSPHHETEFPTADAGVPLSLDEAAELSLLDQPILTGGEAVINADERQAIAAAQLPDPKLTSGLRELPIDTGEAFSVHRDNFTEFTVGLSQDFPRAEKRRLRGERKRLEAWEQANTMPSTGVPRRRSTTRHTAPCVQVFALSLHCAQRIRERHG